MPGPDKFLTECIIVLALAICGAACIALILYGAIGTLL